MSRYSVIALAVSLSLFAPTTVVGHQEVEAPALLPVQKALRFSFEDGSSTIYSLGGLAPHYSVDIVDARAEVRVFDAEQRDVERAFSVPLPPGTTMEETFYAAPVSTPAATGAHLDPGLNHNYNCNAQHFCSDLDVVCSPFCKTWHGMQVNDGAACCSAPGNAFYQYACDSGWSCTIHLWTHYQTQQQTWGQVVCYKHKKPAGYGQNDPYFVWSRSVNNGIQIESWKATFTADTASC